MADAIVDARGNVVAWRHRDVVFDRDGTPVCFIWDQGVFRFDGRCIDWYIDGYFWAADGKAVACTRGATGGPPAPPRYESLVAPVFKPDPPVPRPSQVPRPPRIRSPRWAARSWAEFVAGGAEDAGSGAARG